MTTEHASSKLPSVSMAENPRHVDGRILVKVNIRTNEQVNVIKNDDCERTEYIYDHQVREIDLPEDTDVEQWISDNEQAIISRATVSSTEQLAAIHKQIDAITKEAGLAEDADYAACREKLDASVTRAEK